DDDYFYNNWWNIIEKHCPFFKSIMDYQEWPIEVQKWLCILMGRCLYEVGELDEWQAMGFLLGQAGTGKSLSFNTPVIMYDGSTKMSQDIVIGDILMGDDSKPRNVIATDKGKEKLYRVK